MRRLLLALAVGGVITATLTAAPAPEEKPKLLIVSRRSGNAEIYLVNADGSGEAKNLTNGKANNAYPAWSPDRKRIAFCSDRDGGWNAYVMDADGSNVKTLTRGTERTRVPTWSPDGKKIALCRSSAVG